MKPMAVVPPHEEGKLTAHMALWGAKKPVKETSNVTDYTLLRSNGTVCEVSHKLIRRMFGNVAPSLLLPPEETLDTKRSSCYSKCKSQSLRGRAGDWRGDPRLSPPAGDVDSPRADSSERRFYNSVESIFFI